MSPSSPSDEPAGPSRPLPSGRPPSFYGTPATGPPPGPQHSRTAGWPFWPATRIVALLALALVLLTVPVAWVQRHPASPRTDAQAVENPDSDRGSDAEDLGFSTATPTDEATPAPTDAPTTATTAGPDPTAPAPAPTKRSTPAAPAVGPASTAPTAPADPATWTPPPATPTTPTTPPLVLPAPQTALTDEIVRLTNIERADAGLDPLTISSCLTDQSNYRTAVLVHDGRFEHDSLQPVVAVCGMPHTIGENLILGYADAASVVQGWMDSDGHRANILNPAFEQIGVGCTLGPDGQLCGQLFLG